MNPTDRRMFLKGTGALVVCRAAARSGAARGRRDRHTNAVQASVIAIRWMGRSSWSGGLPKLSSLSGVAFRPISVHAPLELTGEAQ
jgi:hypothetical protein